MYHFWQSINNGYNLMMNTVLYNAHSTFQCLTEITNQWAVSDIYFTDVCALFPFGFKAKDLIFLKK